MATLASTADERVGDVLFDDDRLIIDLVDDGCTIGVPLVWYLCLNNGTSEQRLVWRLSGAGYGIHWPEIDEDLSSEGLLPGATAPRWNKAA